jgi:hypothetical protein
MVFYSATKKNEILSFAVKWKEVENIILSDISRVHQAKNHISPSFAAYRPKANGVILLGTGHILRGSMHMKHSKEKKSTMLMCCSL